MQGQNYDGYSYDESIESKQSYLISEIPDGNDQQAFADFLKQRRPDIEQIDVAYFSMAELMQLVSEFKMGAQQYDNQGYYGNMQQVQGGDQMPADANQQVMLDADNI